MRDLFDAPARRRPGAIHRVAVAEEHVEREATARRGIHVRPEGAVRGRKPLHPVPDAVAVGEGLLDRALGDDHESRVVGLQELESRELRGEGRASAALPLGVREPHVVVGDELGAAVEEIDEAHGAVGSLQGVVGQLHHRQAPALRGDGVQLARRGLLTHPQRIELPAPGLCVDDRRHRSGRGFGRHRRLLPFSDHSAPVRGKVKGGLGPPG